MGLRASSPPQWQPDEIGNIAVLLASGDALRAADKIGPCPLTRGLLRDGSL